MVTIWFGESATPRATHRFPPLPEGRVVFAGREVLAVLEEIQVGGEALRVKGVGDAGSVRGIPGGLLGRPVHLPEREFVALLIGPRDEAREH